MNTFNVVDVETANAKHSSICQIGLIKVVDGEIQDEWSTLINPEQHFALFNVKLHGIAQIHVKNSPTMPSIRQELCSRLRGSILVSHTGFDKGAFESAMDRYGLEQLQVTWLDSAAIVRKTWPDKYGKRGYNLKNVATDLGIEFKHHDALEDARAAAKIVLQVCKYTGLDIQGWV